MDPTQLVYVDVQRYLIELLSKPVSTPPIDERRIECIDIHVSGTTPRCAVGSMTDRVQFRKSEG